LPLLRNTEDYKLLLFQLDRPLNEQAISLYKLAKETLPLLLLTMKEIHPAIISKVDNILTISSKLALIQK